MALLIFGKKKTKTVGIGRDHHLLAIINTFDPRSENLKDVRVLVKFRFGRWMRPINQCIQWNGFIKQANLA